MKTFLLLVFSIFIISSLVLGNSISLDYVEGGWDDGGTIKILPECDITLYFKYDNSDGPIRGGMTNGYKIWTVGGTSFKPVTGEFNTFYPWETYFDIYSDYCFSCDGIGIDTFAVVGVKTFTGEGLPVGVYDDAVIIRTGGIQESETLCIDSSWYPQVGVWKWSPGDIPDWGGPYCYLSVTPPCIFPRFTNCIDNLNVGDCGTFHFDFDASDELKCVSSNSGIPEVFVLLDGPGAIDSETGEWSMEVLPEYDNQVIPLTVGVYDISPCYMAECTVNLNIDLSNALSQTLGDINADCVADIEDLVDYVEFQFNNGPAPVIFEHADCDGSGELDIADLVWMVDWMFNEGPPPYNPWG